MPCSAHILQIAIKKIIDLEPISSIKDSVDDFISYLKNTKKPRIELKKFQKMNNPTASPLRVISPNETRWSSKYDAYQRILKLYEYLSQDLLKKKFAYFKIFDAALKLELEKLVSFLEKFKLLTDILQSDSCVVYQVFVTFKYLVKAIRSSQYEITFKLNALEILKQVWEQHVNRELLYACAYLSHDNDHISFDIDEVTEEYDSRSSDFTYDEKLRIKTPDWISQYGAAYLKQYFLKYNSTHSDLENVLFRQLANFSCWSGKFSLLKHHYDKL